MGSHGLRKFIAIVAIVWTVFGMLGAWVMPMILHRAVSRVSLPGQSCPVFYFSRAGEFHDGVFVHYESLTPCLISWGVQLPIVLFLFVGIPLGAYLKITGKAPPRRTKYTPMTAAEARDVALTAVIWVVLFLIVITVGPVVYHLVYGEH